VVLDEGRLLLVRRSNAPGQGEWSVPGGRVEPLETLDDAVRRELAEETGLAGRNIRFLGWVERISPTHHFVILDFLVDVDDAHTGRPGDDASEIRWVPLTELASCDGVVEGLVAFLRECGVLAG
jgi:ADP-ribose pyrophosphatase YjhB (NUDIX family)